MFPREHNVKKRGVIREDCAICFTIRRQIYVVRGYASAQHYLIQHSAGTARTMSIS